MTEIILNDTVHVSGVRVGASGHVFSETDLLNMAPNDTSIVAKTVGHGSFVVRDGDIRRAQRTVGVSGWTFGGSAREARERFAELCQWPEGHVTLRLVAEGVDVECTGVWDISRREIDAAEISWSATLTCESPYLISHDEQTLFLKSQASSTGGLSWGLAWPLDWGNGGLDGNSGRIRNAGNAVGGPVVTVHGDFPDGVTLMDSKGRSLVFEGPVLSGAPLTLDCRPGRRLALSSGVNRSYLLSVREWFTVPPGGDLTVSFLPHTTGDGWAQVSMHDYWL